MRALTSPLIAILLLVHPSPASAELGIEHCAAQLPGATLERAPTVAGTLPSEPATDNVHICKRSGDTSIFALEYDPDRLGPLWVAYRLSDTFGPDRCASAPRDHMRCHFGRQDVAACLASPSKPGDPFHIEGVLADLGVEHLRTDAFARTRHDRGHMAPNNAFSWHLCGAYKTFTMANMAPRSAIT